MPDHATTAAQLQTSLSLALPPIAVCITDEVPEGVAQFDGQVAAGCVFWERAAQGAFATSSRDHELCSIGMHTHSMAEPPAQHRQDLGTTLEMMAELGYVRPQDVATIPTLERPVRHVVYAPLAATPLPPDVVLLFATARQSLVMVEALQQIDTDGPMLMGRPACAVVPQVVNSGRPAMSLGCCGARAYLDTFGDAISMWAIPGNAVGDYADRIATLAHANSVLGQFHQARKADVAAGNRPSVADTAGQMG